MSNELVYIFFFYVVFKIMFLNKKAVVLVSTYVLDDKH